MLTIRRLMRLIAPLWRWFALATLLGVATIGSSIGLSATSAYLIAKAAIISSIVALQVAIVGVRFFGIARGIMRYFERYVTHDATFKLLAHLRVWFYRTIEPLAPARLLGDRSGDLLARVITDVETLEQFYVRAVAPPLVAMFITALACLLLGLFHIWFGLALLAMLAMTGIVLPLLTLHLSQNPANTIVATRAELSASLVDSVQGSADLLAFGHADQQQLALDRLSKRLNQAQERLAGVRGMSSAVLSLMSNLAALLMLVLAIPLVRSTQIDGVLLALLVLTTISAFEAVAPLSQAAEHLSSSLAAARRLFAITDRQPPINEPSAAAALPQDVTIEFRDLRFRYPNEDGTASALVLNKLSFRLPMGQRLAIVGPSGAGKSTIVQLLLRVWEYQDGQILLGDRDLHDYHSDELRSLISVVSQDTHLFNGSIRENLLVARPQASQADLRAATHQAQIDDFIQQLPQGYDTWIGEQGLQLSGGERQRIAIARALLKDAPILILDEASAQLDAITDQALMTSLETLMRQRTTLMITHRLTNLAHFEQILLLEKGRIVEQGCHHDLMMLGGRYRQLVEAAK